jgi:hypothetical protein
MNITAKLVGLGDLIDAAGSVTASEITLADGSILVGNGSGVGAAVALSGAITITNLGVATLGNNAVTTAKITDANVTLAKLASGITPSHVVKFACKHTTAGGAATESITVAGVVATDVVVVTLQAKGATPRTILTAAADTDQIDLEFSGDPSTDHIVCYTVLRAAA